MKLWMIILILALIVLAVVIGICLVKAPVVTLKALGVVGRGLFKIIKKTGKFCVNSCKKAYNNYKKVKSKQKAKSKHNEEPSDEIDCYSESKGKTVSVKVDINDSNIWE